MTENVTLLFIQLDQRVDFYHLFQYNVSWVLIKVTFNLHSYLY